MQSSVNEVFSPRVKQSLPRVVVADLRTDHAGETGVVCIYQGVLRFARDPRVRTFAKRHLETESEHLRQIEAWLVGSRARYPR